MLKVEGLTRPGVLTDCSFEVRAGEIVGFAGLIGAGRTELARAVFAADPISDGRIELDGHELKLRSPSDAIAAGIGYLTEDRKGDGLAMQLSVAHNITLARIPGRGIWINRRAEHDAAERRREQLDIRTPSLSRPVEALSGGTQQKVVVARWLETEARVLFFDEPSRGIDVGAKAEMFKLMGELAANGRAIVMISSYLPELINMCDRIVVIRDGRTVGELNRNEFDEERIMALASGVEREDCMSTHAAPRPVALRLPGGLRDRLQDVVSQLAAAGGLIVVVIALAIASPYFLTGNNLFNIGVQVSVVAIIAVGQTLVILTAGIDLSVGSVAGLGGILGTMAIAKAGFPIVPGIIIGVLAGAAIGLVNGLLITQMKLPPFIATLGMLGVARGLTFIVGGENAVYGLPANFRLFGEGQIGPIPMPLLYLIVIAVDRLRRSSAGPSSAATPTRSAPTRRPRGCRASALNRYLIAVYVISAALAGFGGMIAASLVHSGQPNYGVGLELNVIAACVIGGASLFGGVGTIGGTLIGAFLMAVITNGVRAAQHHPVLPAGDHRRDHLAGGVVGPGPPAPAVGGLRAGRAPERRRRRARRRRPVRNAAPRPRRAPRSPSRRRDAPWSRTTKPRSPSRRRRRSTWR